MSGMAGDASGRGSLHGEVQCIMGNALMETQL